MDEYKQLRESLNRVPNLRQPELNSIAIAPESQQATVLKQPDKEDPAHEDDQHDHQDTESRVMWDSLDHFIMKTKRHTVKYKITQI